MKKILFFLIITIFLFNSCKKNNLENISAGYNSSSIHKLILKALSGNETANKSLSNLIDLKNPDRDFSKLVIDSIIVKNTKTYYSVLLEFPNPLYNRFAVYNQNLKAYLLDKSLNGYLSEETLNLNDNKYFKVIEDFNSVNDIKLQRLSLYRAGDFSVTLVFRDFTKMIDSKNEYYQKIKEFLPDRIITSINSKKRSSISSKGDVYPFNITKGKYVSTDSLFYKFVKNTLAENSKGKGQNFLKEEKSEITGDNFNSNKIDKKSLNFNMNLSQHWNGIQNVVIKENLKKSVRGIKFVNSTIGSEIAVAQVNYNTQISDYFKYELKNVFRMNPNIRFTKHIEIGKNLVTFYEYKNNCKKFIIILESPKNTYENYKTMFKKILNSFNAEC